MLNANYFEKIIIQMMLDFTLIVKMKMKLTTIFKLIETVQRYLFLSYIKQNFWELDVSKRYNWQMNFKIVNSGDIFLIFLYLTLLCLATS